MKLLDHWKLRRLERELKRLEWENRLLRDIPGHTSAHLPDKIFEIGLQIAILRREIAALKEHLKE